MYPEASSQLARALGRPNKITRSTIVEAAGEIGLEDVTMSLVAERLGVSVGALYRHVRNRAELLGLVVEAELRRGLIPEDTGQHWSDLVREYARMLFERFAQNPALISEYASGGFPPANEVDMMEAYLTAMHRRGFAPDCAIELIRDVRAIAIGSAVVASAMGASRRGADAGEDVDAIFAERAEDLPMLSSARAAYRRTVSDPGFRSTLDKLLATIAATRGETVPAR